MAGVLGFEPRNGGVKVRCLTAWRYPNMFCSPIIVKSGKSQNFWNVYPSPRKVYIDILIINSILYLLITRYVCMNFSWFRSHPKKVSAAVLLWGVIWLNSSMDNSPHLREGIISTVAAILKDKDINISWWADMECSIEVKPDIIHLLCRNMNHIPQISVKLEWENNKSNIVILWVKVNKKGILDIQTWCLYNKLGGGKMSPDSNDKNCNTK